MESYMLPQTILIILLLNIFGTVFKRNKIIPDFYIIFILLGISILLSYLVYQDITLTNTLQGIIAWGLSISNNQIVKQVSKSKEDIKKVKENK